MKHTYIYSPSRRTSGRPVLHTLGWGLFIGLGIVLIAAQLGIK